MKLAICSIVAVLMLAASGLASAQAVKPEDIIKYRKALMTVQSWSIRPLAQMAKGERPYDKELAARNAAMLELTSRMISEGFPAGTDKGADTRAKPDIWQEADKFQQGHDRLLANAAKLTEAAKVGTLDALRVAFGPVSKDCGNCHDNFRTK